MSGEKYSTDRRRSGLAYALLLAVIAPPSLAVWTGFADDTEKWRARLADDGRTARLEDVTGNDCIECHTEIGAQWRDSAHAIA